ncbi:hypothetical protein IAG44_21460 [Streptomyces roseirectus]|uniref:Protein spdB n=1 Tax=Streptomyces roseirectus TaxID=2768066 RepID=A0A7H0IG26_9ACTN|nr:hypothetical protein [Streptomyces roseirectus]QNP71742.1 hypothetical protein IAG44_21460 [Streptomyces roseirectus]
MRARTELPAVGMTAVSMVLTLAVVVMWLGAAMPWPVALVVGVGIDGGWLATLAYERRLAAQGDHNRTVTAVGWGFGVLATGVLVAHALTAESRVGAWLAVAWLPVAAKAMWVVHGLWERTALTPAALDQIRSIRQTARDGAAVDRARLRAEAGTEITRLDAVTAAGADIARVQERTARKLSRSWSKLEAARSRQDTGRALHSVASTGAASWELPVWGPVESIPAPGANAEESTGTVRKRSMADLRESTPGPSPVSVVLTRLPVPDPVAVDLGKSTPQLKPIAPAPIDLSPAPSSVVRAVAAESSRPRRATGRVPESARSPRAKRTADELLAEARALTAGWPDAQITAEGIRRELHTSPVNARLLRDTILADRAAGAA